MFCASLLIKYSVSIMRSVNITFIKIVTKTCRCFIKILDLICTFSKLFFFFLNFSFFFICLLKSFIHFFPPHKAANTSERSRGNQGVTSSPFGVPNLPFVTVCNSFAFSKAQFLVKWYVNFNPVTARPNDKVASGPPLAEMSAPIRNPHAKNRLAWK